MSEMLQVTLRQRAPIPLDAEIICAPGELLALVGPSGSGKSTILRCIAGLHTATEGEVRCGRETWFNGGVNKGGVNLPPQTRRVGLVFQNYALFPHLSAVENVATALGHLPAVARLARSRELLARVHLQGLEERRPPALSGGQQQRVAVARALARVLDHEPAVLLLDEPFSAVDQVTRRKLQGELARLRRDLNIPIVLVTHDLDEARMLADRITILHRGVTLQSGAPDEVLTRPRDAAVARLVHLTNLFEGTLRASAVSGGQPRLEWYQHSLEIERDSGFAADSRVCWVIAPEHVILHQRVRPSAGERENPLSGTLIDCTRLGPVTHLALAIDGNPHRPLAFTVPTHVATRNDLKPGDTIGVSLLAAGIHLMPWESLDERRGD